MSPGREGLPLFSLIVCLSMAGPALADSVRLLPVEDATISERYFDSLLGGDPTLDSGNDGPEGGGLRNRALLKFDLASTVPNGSTVTSANLTLTLVTSPTATNLWFSLRRVLQDWHQSSVSWTNRLSPSAPWSVPGGAAPLDFSSSVSQSNLIVGGTVGVPFTFGSNSNLVADVQGWVREPSNNFGWILLCELEGLERSKRRYASREYANPAQRPSLAIEFVPPAIAPRLLVLPQTNDLFQFLFSAESNRAYTVLFSDDLASGNWEILTNFPSSPSAADVLVSDRLSATGRLYRVRTP